MEYQLIVIGAGPGGYEAALHAAELGKKTALIEYREVGGTCLNRGCVPTKTLIHSSETLRAARDSAAVGVRTEGVFADIGEIFAHKNSVSATLRSGIENMLDRAKVDLLRGKGQIRDAHIVAILQPDGTERLITGENILIATGSVPARPPIPGLDQKGVMTSDELLSDTTEIYRSLIIIGGGVIGVELAAFFAELGTKITIIEGMNRLLPLLDRELGQNLAMQFKKQGIQIFTDSMVQSVEKGEDGWIVRFAGKTGPASASGQTVLCAIGRSPYTEGLFGPGVAVEMNRRSIKVDEHFQTSIPSIYAIGDVSSKIQLAHVATAQGIACVDRIFGVPNSVNLSVVPSCIYCRPEIASVGMTEAEAKEAGLPVRVGKAVMGGNARTLIDDPGRCFMKVVARTDTDVIIGAQLMCEHSTDMISQLSLAVAHAMTAKDLLIFMRPHPTFEEALTDALKKLV